MSSEARLGTFEELLGELKPGTEARVFEIARALRAVILEGLPDAVEVVRLGDGAASFGVGPKKMSESHVYVMPKEGYVNLGFWHGSEVADPEGLLEGTGKKMRHVKVTSVEAARSGAVRALIADALKKRKAALGVK